MMRSRYIGNFMELLLIEAHERTLNFMNQIIIPTRSNQEMIEKTHSQYNISHFSF